MILFWAGAVIGAAAVSLVFALFVGRFMRVGAGPDRDRRIYTRPDGTTVFLAEDGTVAAEVAPNGVVTHS